MRKRKQSRSARQKARMEVKKPIKLLASYETWKLMRKLQFVINVYCFNHSGGNAAIVFT